MRRVGFPVIAMLLAASFAACGDQTTTGDQLVGTWQLAAYDDHGALAATTGTWTFGQDATFTLLGTITYPGEPLDSLDVIGTWMEQTPGTVALTVDGGTTVWDVSVTADTAVLILPDEEGAVRITLAK
jgi:hypothetical protein